MTARYGHKSVIQCRSQITKKNMQRKFIYVFFHLFNFIYDFFMVQFFILRLNEAQLAGMIVN